jgi:hypothetical protein
VLIPTDPCSDVDSYFAVHGRLACFPKLTNADL